RSLTRPPPPSTLFPYTTLFRSIPLARGWFRQNDYPQNRLLYSDDGLARGAYLSWLRSLGIRYVVLTDAPPDYSAQAEAKLLRTGDRKSTRLNSSHQIISYAVFC